MMNRLALTEWLIFVFVILVFLACKNFIIDTRIFLMSVFLVSFLGLRVLIFSLMDFEKTLDNSQLKCGCGSPLNSSETSSECGSQDSNTEVECQQDDNMEDNPDDEGGDCKKEQANELISKRINIISTELCAILAGNKTPKVIPWILSGWSMSIQIPLCDNLHTISSGQIRCYDLEYPLGQLVFRYRGWDIFVLQQLIGCPELQVFNSQGWNNYYDQKVGIAFKSITVITDGVTRKDWELTHITASAHPKWCIEDNKLDDGSCVRFRDSNNKGWALVCINEKNTYPNICLVNGTFSTDTTYIPIFSSTSSVAPTLYECPDSTKPICANVGSIKVEKIYIGGTKGLLQFKPHMKEETCKKVESLPDGPTGCLLNSSTQIQNMECSTCEPQLQCENGEPVLVGKVKISSALDSWRLFGQGKMEAASDPSH